MSAEVIRLDGVTVRYDGETALEDVQLRVQAGDYLAVVGPNGGGKTTLLRTVLGLVRPHRGQVQVLGGTAQKARGRIGYVPQFARFDRDFPVSVGEVVRLGRVGRSLLPWRRAEERAMAERALARVGMAELAGSQIGELSGGQMQRVLIARALVIEPELLLLDEPTASLDSQGAEGFYSLLDSLSERSTVVLVSHDVGRVASHVDRIALVNRHLSCALASEVSPEMIEKAFCCPLDLGSHNVQHRAAEPPAGAA